MKILIRLAPILTAGDLLDPGPARRDRYQSGSFRPLLAETPTPVLIDHDETRPVGRVLAFDEWDDTRGRFVFARCEIDAPPAWLREGTAASFEYLAARFENIGSWRNVARLAVSEVSILSAAARPYEPLARVVLIDRTASPAASSSDGAAGDNALTPRVIRALWSPQLDLGREVPA